MVFIDSTKKNAQELAFSSSLCTAIEKRSQHTRVMLLNAMENVERRSRETKEKFKTELRHALIAVEQKRFQTKNMLSRAKKEILSAIEEKEQNRSKGHQVHGGRVIPAEAVPYFREDYEYNASCGSVLELLFFQRFWIGLSAWVPKSVMPCTLTMLGLVINLLCCSLVLYHSPEGTAEIPPWVMFVCAAGMFLYQTLDALDGKQAYKLQNTHLEELADHGSDSLSASFVILAAATVLQLGSHPFLMLVLCLSCLIGFYSTHWQTHVTDVVVFGKIDVTEGQCLLMLIHILSATYGQSMWHYQLPWLYIEVRQLIVIACIISVCIALIGNLRIICGAQTPLDKIAFIPRKKGISTLYPAMPLIAWLALTLYLSSFQLNVCPCLFIVFVGILFTKLVVKLQLSTMGKGTCEFWDPILFIPLLLAFNYHLALAPPLNALLAAMVVVTMDLLRFVTYFVWDICDFQDIYVFSLKYPLGHRNNRISSKGIYVNGVNNIEVEKKLRDKEGIVQNDDRSSHFFADERQLKSNGVAGSVGRN